MRDASGPGRGAPCLVRQTARSDPCGDAQPGWRGRRGCSCGRGNHGCGYGGGCWAGKYACSRGLLPFVLVWRNPDGWHVNTFSGAGKYVTDGRRLVNDTGRRVRRANREDYSPSGPRGCTPQDPAACRTTLMGFHGRGPDVRDCSDPPGPDRSFPPLPGNCGRPYRHVHLHRLFHSSSARGEARAGPLPTPCGKLCGYLAARRWRAAPHSRP